MIFITTGTQEPFDRLIEELDIIAERMPEQEFIAQVANGYTPKNFPTYEFLGPEKFDQHFSNAKIVIGHAGMGTIISAMMKGKDLIILPRKASLGEHRSDHQIATAKKMINLPCIHVVFSEKDLFSKIEEVLGSTRDHVDAHIGDFASSSLLFSLKSFINRL